MARPRKINPTGPTRRVGVTVSEPVARRLQKRAKRDGITLAELVRRELERVA
jgi:hypothetical protein